MQKGKGIGPDVPGLEEIYIRPTETIKQQGHSRPRISRKQAARQLGLNTENEFDARVERLKRTITRVAHENGIDFEIPLQEATRPSASEET